MGSFSGKLYTSATLTANGNSGWLDMRDRVSSAATAMVFSSALLRMDPSNLATDETLDLTLSVAFRPDGTGEVLLHTFTQVDLNNTEENVAIPGGESTGLLSPNAGTDSHVLVPSIPPYWKLAWTVGGTTKSMMFTLYGSLHW
jgi:hypothetical protein